MPQSNPTKHSAAEPAITARHGAGNAAPDSGANNALRETLYIDVLNAGPYAVRVRSLTHFFAADRTLKFDRAVAFGMRLDRPAGSVVRFESGEIARVRLVRMARPHDGDPPNWRSAGDRTGEVRQRRLRT